MSLHDIPKSSGGRHEHGVDVGFAEQGHRGVDSGRNVDFGGLLDLALVAGLNVPFDVGFEGGPPEAVK